MASRCFSSSSARRFVAGAALIALSATGCRTVRPEDKEHLAEPAMTFGSDAPVAAHEEHVFTNREASFGAGGVGGGGCGCN